jgi:hypothetical protein
VQWLVSRAGAGHLRRHDMTADEYRAVVGLNPRGDLDRYGITVARGAPRRRPLSGGVVEQPKARVVRSGADFEELGPVSVCDAAAAQPVGADVRLGREVTLRGFAGAHLTRAEQDGGAFFEGGVGGEAQRHAALPMPGREARAVRLPGCQPPVSSSRSRRPLVRPRYSRSLWLAS